MSPCENRPLDGRYWEEHWQSLGADAIGEAANPYVVAETSGLGRGTALDAGCGAGAEAVWLAEQGWDVTGADISPTALAKARRRAEAAGLGSAVRWVEADLMAWEPGERWDLVMTSYAHPPSSQVEFYRRISRWVAPGGTLLVVGHLHGSGVMSGDEAPRGRPSPWSTSPGFSTAAIGRSRRRARMCGRRPPATGALWRCATSSSGRGGFAKGAAAQLESSRLRCGRRIWRTLYLADVAFGGHCICADAASEGGSAIGLFPVRRHCW